jgi:protein kinase-like protein/WD40 repeat protein
VTPDARQRIADLFEDALDRPAEGRAAFLDEACAGVPELRREVQSLLIAYERSDGFLERPDLEQLAALVAAGEEQAVLPAMVGPYRVVRELGRGGMGRVLLGERADGQFEQQVALKLIRGDMTSREAVARFLRERQILARLQHPAIARLLDGGVTAAGQPWFAMEYVAGQSITAYGIAQGLGLDERLRLFLDVGDAVAYAHRHQVVHRDLKPSNILVTAEGRVKLLDFGIAKSLEATEFGGTITRTALHLLTPEYAAPEQVRGDPVTAATDVYGLGSVLYELVTGLRVHRFASYSPAEIARVVCDTDPLAPSRVQPAGPLRAERGSADLDAVTLMALRKEPERRYPSVVALLEDVRRYRAGLPVRARQGSVRYRARKFVARHRVHVLILVLLAGLAGALGALRARSRAATRDAQRVREMEAYAQGLREGIAPESAADSGSAAAVAGIRQGRRIAFTSSRSGRAIDVRLVDGDSSILLAENAEAPTWSPDGSRLLFERDGDLYTMSAAGLDLRQLTRGPARDVEPTWSPDGREIAFASDRDGNTDVWAMNVDGSGLRNLTHTPALDGEPAWSPNGRRIAFNSMRDGNTEIYVMNRDGSAPTNLTHSPLWDIEPAWSPDGRSIAFATTRDGNYEVYVMNADGSGVRNLTRHPGRDGQPVWSPDGTMLAFASDRRGNYDVYVVQADGTVMANLTRHPAEDMRPTWR